MTDAERARRLLAAADRLMQRHPVNGLSLVLCLGSRWHAWLVSRLSRK